MTPDYSTRKDAYHHLLYSLRSGINFCNTRYRPCSYIWFDMIAPISLQRLSIDMGIDDIRNTLSQWQSISYKVGDLINVISPDTDTRTILAQFFHIGSIFSKSYLATYWVMSGLWNTQKYRNISLRWKKWPFAFFYNDLKIVLRK